MLDDLKALVKELDQVEREVYRQQTYAEDRDLKQWCSVSGRELADIKSELQGYIQQVETAGHNLR